MDCVLSVDPTKTMSDVQRYLETAGIGRASEDIAVVSVNVEQLLERGHAHPWQRGTRRQTKKGGGGGGPPAPRRQQDVSPSPMYMAERVPVTDPANREAMSGMGMDPKRAEEVAKRNLAATKARLI